MIVSEITLYNTLKLKLGEREAQVVVEGIKGAAKEEFHNRKATLATKEDLAKMETRMIKWMFLFVLGLFFSLTTVIFAMFNLYLKH